MMRIPLNGEGLRAGDVLLVLTVLTESLPVLTEPSRVPLVGAVVSSCVAIDAATDNFRVALGVTSSGTGVVGVPGASASVATRPRVLESYDVDGVGGVGVGVAAAVTDNTASGVSVAVNCRGEVSPATGVVCAAVRAVAGGGVAGSVLHGVATASILTIRTLRCLLRCSVVSGCGCPIPCALSATHFRLRTATRAAAVSVPAVVWARLV